MSTIPLWYINIVTHLVYFVFADVEVKIKVIDNHNKIMLVFYLMSFPLFQINQLDFLCVTYMYMSCMKISDEIDVYTACDTIFKFIFFTHWNPLVLCRKVKVLHYHSSIGRRLCCVATSAAN